MKTAFSLFAVAAVVVLMIFISATVYTVSETEQVIITQFGKPIGEPITDAGLHVKMPFIQKVNRLDKRVLEWDGPPARMPTRDKVYIVVDNFARWRIIEPQIYFEQLRDERAAQSRLDDILGSETRNSIAKHDFIEAVRTTKDRVPTQTDISETPTPGGSRVGSLPPVAYGRSVLEQEIFTNAAPKVKSYGIELLDVRFKRLNYSEAVSQKIYDRMMTERNQIAERYRSMGAAEAAKIDGNRERELKQIESEAYRKVQEIEGSADARATEIYAKAYNGTPEARELFGFLKTMETYKKIIGADSSLILSTDSDLFRYLKSDSSSPPSTAGSAASPLDHLPSLIDIPTPARPAATPPVR